MTTENVNLRAEWEASNKNTYSSVVSTFVPSPTSGSPQKSGNNQQKTDNLASLPPELLKITSRVDQLEQDSLSNVLMLQGSALDAIISTPDRDTAAAATQASAGTSKDQQLQPSQTSLKKFVCDILRSTVPHVTNDWITHVSIQGRDRKHLKITCLSNDEKTRLVSSLKSAKPLNLYANDYLVKVRSSLLYTSGQKCGTIQFFYHFSMDLNNFYTQCSHS